MQISYQLANFRVLIVVPLPPTNYGNFVHACVHVRTSFHSFRTIHSKATEITGYTRFYNPFHRLSPLLLTQSLLFARYNVHTSHESRLLREGVDFDKENC